MPTSRELTDETLISRAHELRRRALQGDMQARELAHEYEIELRIRLKQRTAESLGKQASPSPGAGLQSRVTDDFSKAAAPPATATKCRSASADGDTDTTNDVSGRVVDALLRNARELLEMDIAFVAELPEDRRSIGHVDADASTPDRVHVCDSREPVATRLQEIGAYLSAPVILPNGEIYGTLCCISHRPRTALGNRQVDALRTVAALVSTEIEKIRRMSAA